MNNSVANASGPARSTLRYHLPLIVALAIAAGTEAFVSSAVSIALPRIGADFAASPDDISWAVTVYLAAYAIALPVSAWGAAALGQKRYLGLCMMVYLLGSMGCFLSVSLSAFLVMRTVQGAAGAAFVARALFSFTKEFRPPNLTRALFIFIASFSLKAVGLPVGGFLIDHHSWRWIFVAAVGLLGLVALPLLISSREIWPRTRHHSADFFGLGWLALSLGSALVILARGQRDGWWGSEKIVALLTALSIALPIYLWREHHAEPDHSVLPSTSLGFKGMRPGVLLSFLAGFMLSSGLYVIPQFLLGVLRWDAYHTGLVLSLDSFALMAGLAVAAWTLGRIMTRLLVVCSGVLFSVSMILLALRMSSDTGVDALYLPAALRGFSVGLALPPIGVFSFVAIGANPKANGEGRAWHYTARQVGAAVGTAFVVGWLDLRLTVHSSHLTQSLSLGTSPLAQDLGQIGSGLVARGFSPANASQAARLVLARVTAREASVLAYQDTFWVLAVVGVLLAGLALCLPRVRRPAKVSVPGPIFPPVSAPVR